MGKREKRARHDDGQRQRGEASRETNGKLSPSALSSIWRPPCDDAAVPLRRVPPGTVGATGTTRDRPPARITWRLTVRRRRIRLRTLTEPTSRYEATKYTRKPTIVA